jgi:rhodanese-related sulfurtransferase
MKIVVSVLGVIALSTLAVAMFQQQSNRPVISAKETYERMQSDSNIVILDVRTPEEFRSATGHLAGAILIPVHELEERVDELEPYREKTIIAVCRSGSRSGSATSFLNGKGFKVLNMEGGMLRWNKENLPVVRE